VAPGAELEAIAVTAEHQRRGLGRKLLEQIFEGVRKRGVSEIWLEVRVSNEPAIRIYRRAGMREVGLRKGYYADPAEDASVMSLTIG